MALSCIPKSVLSSANCIENPAGLSNHMFAVPLANVESITANDSKNQYDITLGTGVEALLGYRIDFKAQTGQYTSEDNGTGKGWTGSVTGRVELSEDDMAFTSRILHNSDKNLYFVATGKSKTVTEGEGAQAVTKTEFEYIVIGNENGEAEIQVTADTGAARTDDHGQTFTATCAYQLYPLTKWWGVISQADAE